MAEYYSADYSASTGHPSANGYSSVYQQHQPQGYGEHAPYYQQQVYQQQQMPQCFAEPSYSHAAPAGMAQQAGYVAHDQYSQDWQQPQQPADQSSLPPLPRDAQPPLPDGPPPLPPMEQPPLPSDPHVGTHEHHDQPLPPLGDEVAQGQSARAQGMAPFHNQHRPWTVQQYGSQPQQMQYVGYQQQASYQQQPDQQHGLAYPHSQQYPAPQYPQHQYQQQYPQQIYQQHAFYANSWGAAGGGAVSSQLSYGPPTATASMRYSIPTASAQAPPALPPTAPHSQAVQPGSAIPGQAAAHPQQAQQPLQPSRRDITELLLPPGRDSRPKRLVLILRGLPGSGKSHAARLVRDRETEQGGEAPRILSLDDYFVAEVEKEVEDEEAGGKKGKKRKVTSMEYCYEAEMEGVYKKSLLKAYQRTLDEGRFKFVILDAPNTRVADFKDFWMTGQAAGYEVFVVEMSETDPQVCHQRNQHGRLLADLYQQSADYEPTPTVYTCLDVSGLMAKQVPRGKASINDVEMGEDEEGSDVEHDDSSAPAPSSSRWAQPEDDSPSAKRARLTPSRQSIQSSSTAGTSMQSMGPASTADASYDGLTDGLDELLEGSKTHRAVQGGGGSGGRGRGILLGNGGSSAGGKKVRWPDQMEEDDQTNAGFRIGTESRQLETVYLVSGLGPPPDGEDHPHAPNFAEAVRAEHKVEASAFRSILLGGAHKHPGSRMGV